MNNQKNIIVSEILYPDGHKSINKRYLEILSTLGHLTIVDDGVYLRELVPNIDADYITIEKPSLEVQEKYQKLKKILPFFKFEFIIIWRYYQYLKTISRLIKKIEYDKIIFFSTRLDALALSLPLFRKGKVAAIHHNDIDGMINRPIDRFLFKMSKNKYSHISFAEFINDGLNIQYQVRKENLFLVNEPLKEGVYFDSSERERKPIIIGLGQTCTREDLDLLIEIDKKNRIELFNKIILRDKSVNYEGNNLSVFSRYLSNDEFEEYLNYSSACLLLYPKDFQLRYSGILDDALSHGLVVYGSDIPVIRFFSKLYPHSCFTIENMERVFDLASNRIPCADNEEIHSFKESHSDKTIKKQWERLINNKLD